MEKKLYKLLGLFGKKCYTKYNENLYNTFTKGGVK